MVHHLFDESRHFPKYPDKVRDMYMRMYAMLLSPRLRTCCKRISHDRRCIRARSFSARWYSILSSRTLLSACFCATYSRRCANHRVPRCANLELPRWSPSAIAYPSGRNTASICTPSRILRRCYLISFRSSKLYRESRRRCSGDSERLIPSSWLGLQPWSCCRSARPASVSPGTRWGGTGEGIGPLRVVVVRLEVVSGGSQAPEKWGCGQ